MALEFVRALAWPIASIVIILAVRSIVKMVISKKADFNFSFKDLIKFGASGRGQEKQLETTAPNAPESNTTEGETGSYLASEAQAGSDQAPEAEAQPTISYRDIFSSKDPTELASLFVRFKAESPGYGSDPDFWETFYVRRRKEAGIGDYVQELKSLADSNPTWVWPLIHLTQRHVDLNDIEQAEATLRQALSRSSAANRIWALAEGVRTYFKLFGFDRALEFVYNEAKSDLTDGQNSALFGALASECKKAGDKESYLVAREIALVFSPDAPSDRFDLAYEYAEDGHLSIPAYRHYLQMLRTSSDWYGPPNNLGVLVSDRLQNEYFELSISLGNRLAAANLSNKLVEAGFIGAAEQLLSRFEEGEEAAENIARSKSKALAARRQLEKDKASLDGFVEAQYARYRAALMDGYRHLCRDGPDIEPGAFVSVDRSIQVFASKDGAACRFPFGSVILEGILPRKALCFFGTLSSNSGGLLNFFSVRLVMVPVSKDVIRVIQWPSDLSRDSPLNLIELRRFISGPLTLPDSGPEGPTPPPSLNALLGFDAPKPG